MIQSPQLANSTSSPSHNKHNDPKDSFAFYSLIVNTLSIIEKRAKQVILGKPTGLAPDLAIKYKFLFRMSLVSVLLFAQALLYVPSFAVFSLLFLAYNAIILYLLNKQNFIYITGIATYGPSLITMIALIFNANQYLLVLAISFTILFANSFVVLSRMAQFQSFGLLLLSYEISLGVHKFNVHGVFNLILMGFCLSATGSQVVSGSISKRSKELKGLYEELEIKEKKIAVLEGQRNELEMKVSALTYDLSQKAEELLLANNSREIFLNTMSSEFRNPLNSLIGYLDLLQMDLEDPSSLEKLDNAKHCSELLLCLINNQLDCAKLLAGKLDLHPQPHNIFWFIEKLWAVASPNIKVKNLNGIILVSKNVPPVLEFDQHRLMQICQNLINNSIKFTSKGYVKVRFSWTADLVRESPALGNRGIFPRNVPKKAYPSSVSMTFLPTRMDTSKVIGPNLTSARTTEELNPRYKKSQNVDSDPVKARKAIKNYILDDQRITFPVTTSQRATENSPSKLTDSAKSRPSGKTSYDSALSNIQKKSKIDDTPDLSLPPVSDSENEDTSSVGDLVTLHSSLKGASIKDIRIKNMDFDELNFNVRRFKSDVYKRQRSPQNQDLNERSFGFSNDDNQIERGKLFIEITDSGCGITREAQDRIFSPFEIEDSTRTFGGAGLGLYITKQLVEKMGGNIKIESELDVGSYIMVSIPMRTSLEKVTRTISMQLESLDTKKDQKRALVVDDSEYNRDILEKFLKKYKMEVHIAKNGAEAVNLYTTNPVDYFSLITMDLQMPVMDGLTACKMIRNLEKEHNIGKKVPIVIISGNLQEREFCLDPNGPICANYYFRKPLTFADLETFLPKLLKGRSGERLSSISLRAKCNVLIVDDDIMGVQFLQNFFKKFDCSTSLATDGEKAVEMVENMFNKLDLILFNCEVPNNPGMEAALAIKKFLESKQKSNVKIVLLSGKIDENLKQLCEKSGLNYLLSKPVKVQLLKQLLQL